VSDEKMGGVQRTGKMWRAAVVTQFMALSPYLPEEYAEGHFGSDGSS
jgi:hypothetical protein